MTWLNNDDPARLRYRLVERFGRKEFVGPWSLLAGALWVRHMGDGGWLLGPVLDDEITVDDVVGLIRHG